VDTTKAINTISFFTGYGGIERGLKLAGERVNHIASCEIEAYAEANLIYKMETGALPPHPIWTDAKTFPGPDFLGKVDLFTGGFPCQPFSAAGSRNADEDPRHLWPSCLRAIESFRPNRVFLENVEGLISAKLGGDNWADPKGTPVLLHVLRELERRGYKATWGIFSAEEVGAPHRRKRVFILAQLADSNNIGISGGRSQQECENDKSRLQELERRNENRIWSEAQGFSSSPRGEKLANSESREGGRNAMEREEQRQPIIECKSVAKLANSDSERLEGPLSTRQAYSEQRSRQDEITARCSSLRQNIKLAQSDSERSYGQLWDSSNNQERRKEERRYIAPKGIWPTRPGERQGPTEQPRVKPKLGRAANGNTYRVDRLRLLGNGVVPQTAALAWIELNKKINK